VRGRACVSVPFSAVKHMADNGVPGPIVPVRAVERFPGFERVRGTFLTSVGIGIGFLRKCRFAVGIGFGFGIEKSFCFFFGFFRVFLFKKKKKGFYVTLTDL
jgi:hypothetical protein